MTCSFSARSCLFITVEALMHQNWMDGWVGDYYAVILHTISQDPQRNCSLCCSEVSCVCSANLELTTNDRLQRFYFSEQFQRMFES